MSNKDTKTEVLTRRTTCWISCSSPVLPIFVRIFGQWVNISCTIKNTVNKSNFASRKPANSHYEIHNRPTQVSPLITTSKASENTVLIVSTSHPTIQTTESITSETLNTYHFCPSRWNSGYASPFWDGTLSSALMKSKLLPPQLLLQGSVVTALNNCQLKITLLFTTGTSRPKRAIDMVIDSLPSQKLKLKLRRIVLLPSSNEYTFSRCDILERCFIKQTKLWWRRAWNKHIW